MPTRGVQNPPVTERHCPRCGQVRHEHEFPRHNRLGSPVGACGICEKERARRYSAAHRAENAIYRRIWCARNPQRARATRRASMSRLRHVPGYSARISRERRRRDPEKFHARATIQRLIRSGRLGRGKCVVCGASGADGHHSDYSKPLEVSWVCRKHHFAIHGKELTV